MNQKRFLIPIRPVVIVTKNILTRSKFFLIVIALSFGFFVTVFKTSPHQINTNHHIYDVNLFDSETNSPDYELNNFALNRDIVVKKDRYRDVPESQLKTILMWNDAYGNRDYDFGHGRENFYKHLCPETRCVTTANRSYLPRVEDFDAILIHQRAIDWKDMPKARKPHQRFVQWIFESQQYIYMDINELNGYFNWTMSFKKDSDIYSPYGYVRQIRDHPTGDELTKYIQEFGMKNRHLVGERNKFKAAWFVSHCATQSRRERYIRMMRKNIQVDIYGKCGKMKCDRKNETSCYINMEKNYRFYLSFENSICQDYVTEKFFNILKYNVIPVVYGGADYSKIAPPHSFINALDFKKVGDLTKFLQEIQDDDAKFAEYFWWKDFYEVRSDHSDRAQAYCELCRKLHDKNEPPKVYKNMYKWWVTDSKCRKLSPSTLWDI